MNKYTERLENLSFDLLHIAQSFANDNKSPLIEPAHLFRALLHKSAGLVHFIEDTLDEDYYYLVDWSDMRVQQCAKSAYGMKGIELSQESKMVLKEAVNISERCGLPDINAACILASLVTPGIGFSYEQLKTMPLQSDKIMKYLVSDSSVHKENNNAVSKQPVNIADDSEYCISMISSLPDSPIIGFEKEMRAVIDILARKDRANILIIGETGVGKTSLIEGFLQLLRDKNVPASLLNIQPYELELITLSQGVSYKGEIEDRFKKVTESLLNNVQPVLVIENFHRVEDKQSVLNGILPVLKKLLSKNRIQIICTATIDGFTKDIEKDKEFTAFFEKITVDEPSEKLAVEILKSKCDIYQVYHNLPVEDDIPEEIVRLAKRYMPDRHLPSSALDLLDRAMASVKVENELADIEGGDTTKKRESLQKEAIRDVVSKMTGIPMGNIQSEEREKLSNAEEILHKRVVGQSHAIKSILDAIYESRSGLNKKGQPMGSFFFLGPTGTGKTELAKSLAEFLFNDETSILRFDMSEYKEEHSVALLYGAPPGYVGYEEGGLLVNQIRQHPYSVVLFDEIEKAHRSVFDLFLQILDEGKLHDRLGRIGDFSNSLIIFTSNIGSDYIFQSFGENKIPTHDNMLEVMQGQFRPEFLARLTEIVPFSPITEEMIDRIFDIHIKNLLKTLHEQNIELEIDESARKYVTKVGFNAHYGARPILGIIRKEIRRPLSKLIISGDIKSGDKVLMVYDDERKEINWEISDDSEIGE